MIPVTKPDLPSLGKYMNYLRKIWASRWLTNDGALVQQLGSELKRNLKVDGLVLVANGTMALHLALRVLNLKGEIITTPFTFAATTNVPVWEGLTPVFADINPDTFNLDPTSVEEKITSKTSAILAVHVYGNPCYVKELQEIADRKKLRLIYDAAHAFGVEYQERSVLAYGDISTLSFHATKVFNTVEGGAVVARDPKIVENLVLLRNHGIKSEEQVALPGTNAKMNEFQAAMGLCNLENLDKRVQLRKKIYDRYLKRLNRNRIHFQRITASKYNYAYMPVVFANKQERDLTYIELLKRGVKSRKYFYPLTTQSDYFKEAVLGRHSKFRLQVASSVAERVLCLPMYSDLELPLVDRISSHVNRIISR